jgi:HAD superfamily hydrolase (TIGR01509 family)
VESEITRLRHKAFTGELTFTQYKTQVFKLYNITDPRLVAQGVERAIKEKEEVHFFLDTVDTLETLKKRDYYLGIITDTTQPLHAKLNKLERGGIGHYWDSIIPSSEVGVHKPDPEIYHMALRQLGVSADQAVFVGHKSSELEGARNVGITTIAYNYDRDAEADYYIDHFSELASLPIIN